MLIFSFLFYRLTLFQEPLTEEYIVTSLPSKEQALDVVEVTHLLSQRGTNELGNFEVQYAHDPIALQALER